MPDFKSLQKWLHQRPWLLLPFLSVFPLTAVYVNQQYPPPPEAPSIAIAPPIASPIASPIAMTPSPLPTPAGATISTSPAPPKPSATPSPDPVDSSKYAKQQAALNARTQPVPSTASGSVDSLIEMHVAIAMGVNAVSIASSNGATITDADGNKLQQLSTQTAYPVQSSGDTLNVGSSKLPSIVMVEPTAGGVLYLGDKPYRGRFVLAAQNSHVWVVNYINLRQYLHSVVASEVSPSWSPEALKAQAVAARSYALTYYFKPVNNLYNMGSDEYYQVYSGMAKEDERTNRAVDATAGEFVSYKGGIVESLYAASDSIVLEAFKGRGMSQLGALNLAEKGYNYLQILATYYPKTGVGKFEQDHE